MSSISVVQMPIRPAGWDEAIRGFSTKTLFHESAWLDFMLAMKFGSAVDYFEIRRNRSAIGYFCALRHRKFIVSLYRTVWFGTTVFQGPVINFGENQTELVSALLSASEHSGIHILQMRNDWLDTVVMQRLGFAVTTGLNHVCPLPHDESAAWLAMRGICRTRIRKAEREGLIGHATKDPAIADCFHSFYRKTLETKGLVAVHSAECYRTLMRLLVPADRIFAVCVKHDHKIIGVGFYAYDESAMYYLDGASDPACLHLCPNELLHWTAMKMAIARGIPAFNIGGGPAPSRFSQKFGGSSVGKHSVNPLAGSRVQEALQTLGICHYSGRSCAAQAVAMYRNGRPAGQLVRAGLVRCAVCLSG